MRQRISNLKPAHLIVAALIVSLIVVGGIIVHVSFKTPMEYAALAQTQLHEKNYRAALKNLTKAAEGGMAESQYTLAVMYDVGDKIPENRDLALKWMKAAADQDYPNALYAMGVWMQRGYMGDYQPADLMILYERAAEKGNINAITGLIALYDGENPDRQAYWYRQLQERKNKNGH